MWRVLEGVSNPNFDYLDVVVFLSRHAVQASLEEGRAELCKL